MPIERIFPVVVAGDAPALLELTLSSLREFPEVIVHVQETRDELVALCAAFPNTHLIVRADLVGGRARNHGASVAAGEWILALTAGEFPSDCLLASLKQVELDDLDAVYAIEQHRLLMSRPIRWGGWRPRWRARLYNRHRYQFRETPLAEQLVLASNTRRKALKGTLWFEPVESLEGLLHATAERARLRRWIFPQRHSAAVAALRSLWIFLADFVLRLGCLEGRRGFIVAIAASVETFFACVAWPAKSSETDTARTISKQQMR